MDALLSDEAGVDEGSPELGAPCWSWGIKAKGFHAKFGNGSAVGIGARSWSTAARSVRA